MKLVIANITTAQERDAEFLRIFKNYRAKIAELEPGTLNFDLYRSDESERDYTIVEVYRDEAAYEAHCGSSFRDELIGQIRATLDKASAARFQSVDLESI